MYLELEGKGGIAMQQTIEANTEMDLRTSRILLSQNCYLIWRDIELEKLSDYELLILFEGENEMEYELFISYSHDDKEKVNLLIERLRADGFRLWVDEEQIGGGDQLRKVMVDGIKQSAHVMICLSPSYLEKKWTTFESAVNQAMDPDNRDHRTIPVIIEPCEIPAEYCWLCCPDLTSPVNWETEFQKAIKNIRR